MAAQSVCRCIWVTFFQSVQNCPVLSHRLFHPATQSQLLTSEWLKPAVQIGGFRRQKVVAGFTVNNVVETLVLEIIGIRVACVDSCLTVLVRCKKISQCFVRNPRGCQPPADCFEFGHDLKHFDQLDRARLAHKSPAAGDQLDQARSGKSLQSFTNWRSRYLKLLCKFHFIQTIAVLIAAVEYPLFDLLRNDICVPNIHSIYILKASLKFKISDLVYKNID